MVKKAVVDPKTVEACYGRPLGCQILYRSRFFFFF
jgi:hypothetical protein